MNILIFGGTTEGRELAERLAAEILKRRCPESQREQNSEERKRDFLTVSVATELGAEELQKIEGIGILVGRMDIPAMKKTLCGYDLCIDATHPYAVEATENIRTACAGRRDEWSGGSLCQFGRRRSCISGFPGGADFAYDRGEGSGSIFRNSQRAALCEDPADERKPPRL